PGRAGCVWRDFAFGQDGRQRGRYLTAPSATQADEDDVETRRPVAIDRSQPLPREPIGKDGQALRAIGGVCELLHGVHHQRLDTRPIQSIAEFVDERIDHLHDVVVGDRVDATGRHGFSLSELALPMWWRSRFEAGKGEALPASIRAWFAFA